MAYGNNNGSAPQKQAFVPKTAPAAPSKGAATPVAQTAAEGQPERLSLFKVFKNKGQGYSTVLKEDVTIPAGTRVAIFEDILKGKDGTEYNVLNVKRMKDRETT